MRRSLGSFDVICIGLNAIVGSGIFLLPDDLYRQLGWLSPLAFALVAVGLLPVALCYAEASTTIDETGGPYLYATRAWGQRVGFSVGWMCYANAVFSFAAVSSAAAAAFGHLFLEGADPWLLRGLALVGIAAFGTLNYLGAKPGAVGVNLFTIAKFSVLLVLVAVLVPRADLSAAGGALPRGFEGLGTAVFIALFAAQGFEVVPVPAGETRSPERHVPRAIVGSLLTASLLYVVVQTVLVLSFDDLGQESNAPLVAAAASLSPSLGTLLAVGALVSTVGFVAGSALGAPRYLFATAKDRHLPVGLSALHPRFASPHRAVVCTALLAAVFAALFDYRSLVGMSNVAVAVQYLATCLSVLVLRRASRDAAVRQRRPWLPLLGVLVSVWIFTQASWVELGWASGAMLCGWLLRAFTREDMTAAR